MEFKEFPKITRTSGFTCTVTQKLHGTNASVWILPDEHGEFTVGEQKVSIRAGRRTDFVYPEKDNYGFARFVDDHKAEFVAKLGIGVWFGEWCGPGINSGEGLTEKTLFLFDVLRLQGKELPPRCRLVPLLYAGPVDQAKIDACKKDLLENGSKAVPGFMRPEGIVIALGNQRFKDVFEPETTKWTEAGKDKAPKEPGQDFSAFLQPLRLEKLLSRNEAYVRDLPQSLPTIVKDYLADLEAEGQLDPDPDRAKAQKKAMSSQVFHFVRTVTKESPHVA